MRILVVEDESAIARAIRSVLELEGYAVDVVGDGRDALDWATAVPYDLVILDVVLPGLSGLEVCSRLRDQGVASPVLMLTALDQVRDRVNGLDRGADDYLAKPFAVEELRARIRALLRRNVPARRSTIRVGDLEIDPARHAVQRAGRAIRLTRREFAVLEVLARNPGQVFSHDRLLESVWSTDLAPASNIVEVYIRSLRRKIDGGRADLIETIRGLGYRLRSPADG